MADLPHALTLIVLVAGTLDYAFLLRHREEQRDSIRWQAELQDSLRFARRMLDTPQPRRRWKDSTHFQLER